MASPVVMETAMRLLSASAKLHRGRGSWPCVTAAVITSQQFGAEKDPRGCHTLECGWRAQFARESPCEQQGQRHSRPVSGRVSIQALG